MASLFEAAGLDKTAPRPLADRLRPERLADVVGQDHLLGPDGALTRMLAAGLARLADLLGPAGHRQDDRRAAARQRDRPPLRADLGGLLRRRRPEEGVRGGPRAARRPGRGTLLFVDEIHRFNRAQQDSFLPVMEDGTVTLVGATTENPSFELNAALLLAGARAGLQAARCEARSSSCWRAPRQIEGGALPLDADARAMLIAHGRRRRPRRADAGRGGLARGAARARSFDAGGAAARSSSGARRSTTRRRTATTT